MPMDNLDPGQVSANNASGIHNTDGAFWFNYENVPQGQPLWMLISSDVIGDPGQASQSKCEVAITRTVSWRDPIGMA